VERTPDTNLVLIGPRGSGKSTVGALAARSLGRGFKDADREVVGLAGRSIEEIFRTGGEEAFRRLESEVIATLSPARGLVIALGGGAVEREENVTAVRRGGIVCFLAARPLVLYRRVRADPKSGSWRPPLTGLDPLQELDALVRRRLPLYRASADFEVDTEGACPEEIAREVERLFLERGHGRPLGVREDS